MGATETLQTALFIGRTYIFRIKFTPSRKGKIRFSKSVSAATKSLSSLIFCVDFCFGLSSRTFPYQSTLSKSTTDPERSFGVIRLKYST